MTSENLKHLTDALRSGKYKQGRIHLRHGDDHCCLGVGCEVYQEIKGDLVVDVDEHGIRTYDGSNAYLPAKVQTFYGMTFDGRFEEPVKVGETGCTDLTRYSPNQVVANLTACNDSLGLSFSQIADLIDSRPMAKSNGSIGLNNGFPITVTGEGPINVVEDNE